MKKSFKIILVILIQFLFIQEVNAASTSVSANVQHYYVRTMSTNYSTQISSYEYTTNPFYTANISESRWLPRLIGFDGNISTSFNSNYTYTLTYRLNYPSSKDIFDWQQYMNYANFKIYGSTNDLFSCSIISNTSSYTDVKCTFKRNTTDNYFFFYFDFYDNYNALKTIGIPSNSGPELSFANITLVYTQDNSDTQIQQNNIIINQNNQTNQKLDDVNSNLNDLNSNLNDSDTSEATNSASDFFNGFTTDTFGLTSIITSPLTLIGSITSSTCSPLSLEFPFLTKNNKLNLPCMSSIYEENFGSFLTIYQTITFGIVAYWVCVKIFALVKEFKNPDSDKVEVLDL